MSRRWSVGLVVFLLAFVGACQVLAGALIPSLRELLVVARYLPEDSLAIVLSGIILRAAVTAGCTCRGHANVGVVAAVGRLRILLCRYTSQAAC